MGVAIDSLEDMEMLLEGIPLASLEFVALAEILDSETGSD